MKRKFLSFLLLPFIVSLSMPLLGLTSINTDLKEVKSENPNNYYMVEYESGDDMHSTGNSIQIDVHETELGQYISSSTAWINFLLKDGYTMDDFSDASPTMYFTLYDSFNSGFEPVETISAIRGEEYWLGHIQAEDTETNDVVNVGIEYIAFEHKLEEFHDYRIGFNINQGDDMVVYSDSAHLATPELANFSSIPDETSLTINYELVNPSTTVTFDYDEIYLKIDGRKIDLNNETSGEVVVDNLKPARKYTLSLGYDATKIVTSTNQYNIKNEIDIEVATLMPPNYGAGVIAIATILLIILIIVILILIAIILYWNHQRRKISGLALVVGEDTEAYDPVYQYNYYQEDEAGVPNATSSNQGDEVYGYFDEVKDNQEEPYGYFDEVQDEYYQDEEIAGYFDEVQEDYYEDDVYDIDHLDEGEWF